MSRFKLSLLIFLSVLICYVQSAYSHAVVTDHSLKISPVKAGKASQVTLNFNAHIELRLSTFFLVKAGDQHQALNFSAGAKPGQVILELPPLDAGKHALRFKIFAADGHLSEDIIRFVVQP